MNITKFLFTLFIGILSLTSCSNDESIDAQASSQIETLNYSKTSGQLTAKDIAAYHNIAVDLYFENNEGAVTTIKDIENSIIESLVIHYPELMKDFKIPDDYNFIKTEYEANSINNSKLERLMDTGFDKLVSEHQITPDLANQIKSLTLSDLSFEEKMTILNSFQAKNIEEKEIIEVYKEIFIASNELWNQSNSPAGKRMKCSSGVLAADAVGGVLGLIGSPVWSIIQGAVVSIAVNESCD